MNGRGYPWSEAAFQLGGGIAHGLKQAGYTGVLELVAVRVAERGGVGREPTMREVMRSAEHWREECSGVLFGRSFGFHF